MRASATTVPESMSPVMLDSHCCRIRWSKGFLEWAHRDHPPLVMSGVGNAS